MSRIRDPACTILISNISLETTEIKLRELFSTCGQILSFSFENTNTGAKSTRAARCEYPDAEIAKVAVKSFNGHLLNGKPLSVTHVDKFASRQTQQQVIGSNAQRELTNRPIVGDKHISINDGSIQSILGSMTEREQAEILCEFKHLATYHPDQMRQLLVESPQFSHAILSLMTMFQLVDTQSIDQYVANAAQQPAPTSQVPQGIDPTAWNSLDDNQRALYERWQSYSDVKKAQVREKVNSPETQDPQFAGIIALFNSLQDRLQIKL